MNYEKPKMRFIARHICNKIYLKPSCDKSFALMELLSQKGPRGTLETNELPSVARMGFEIDVVGDVKEFKKEVKRSEK